MMVLEELRAFLGRIFSRYHNRETASDDPVSMVWGYSDLRDRELAALVASSLALGRVAQIKRSVGRVLSILGPKPYVGVEVLGKEGLKEALLGFRHRFFSGDQVASLLHAASVIQAEEGSLGALVERRVVRGTQLELVDAASALVSSLEAAAECKFGSLLPDPARGSASKRLFLMFRWLVRRDDVDPGGWNLPMSSLVLPLDVHVHRAACRLGLTRRSSPSLAAALEATDLLCRVDPEDPVRFDLSLARWSMDGFPDAFGAVL